MELRDRPPSGAVPHGDRLHAELLQRIARIVDPFPSGAHQMKAPGNRPDSALAAQVAHVGEGVYYAGVRATQQNNRSGGRVDHERLIVRNGITIETLGVPIELSAVVLKRG